MAVIERQLISRRPCPVTEAEILDAWSLVEAATAAGDDRQVLQALDVYEQYRLIRDRWSVRHGPTPFLDFVRRVRPDLLIGLHHRMLAAAFERIARGELTQLMVFMPPGHTKSLFASVLLPAWLYGLRPEGRILAASHTTELAEDFGREVRAILQSDEYQRLFPGVAIRVDQKAAGAWATTRGGKYRAVGVGAAVAGRRADLLAAIDDPISEQDAYSQTKRDAVNRWYGPGFRTRFLPGTPVVLMMTRWHEADLAGFLLKQAKSNPKAPKWEVIRVPGILGEADASRLNRYHHGANDNVPRAEAGQPPFPQLFPLDEMEALRASMPPREWSALYMQRPRAGDGGIMPAEWWRVWPDDKPLPEIESLLQVWDTAFEASEANDFNASTVWGLFRQDGRPALMLLGRFHERLQFPDLRQKAVEWFHRWDRSPSGPVDVVMIEKKASGQSLIQEMQTAGLPVMPWAPERNRRGQEVGKIPKAHAASVVLWSGLVYRPDRAWAEEVVDECAAFPNGEHDDLVDTCAMAWLWLRRTHAIPVPGDASDDDDDEGGGGTETSEDDERIAA